MITPRAVKSVAAATAAKASFLRFERYSQASQASQASQVRFVPLKFAASESEPFDSPGEVMELAPDPAKPAAPIRVTSPGLTVYKGGAATPRLYFIKQHLGNLEVNRQVLDVSVSYTPSPRVQLEVEVPVSRTSFANGLTSGSASGLGNITLWSKYRFYLAPGLQYAAATRFVVEGSLQFPLIRNAGPLVLRTDRNILFGVRYLF